MTTYTAVCLVSKALCTSDRFRRFSCKNISMKSNSLKNKSDNSNIAIYFCTWIERPSNSAIQGTNDCITC